MNKVKEFSERFHREAKWGDRIGYRFIDNAHIRKLHHMMNRRKHYLFRYIGDLPRNARVLDWGCGCSGLSFALKREFGFESFGVDISRAAIRRNKEFAETSGIDVSFTEVDGARLPFEDGYFDGIISTDVFGHLDDPGGSLAELNRVLRDGGVLALHTETKFEKNYFYRRIEHLLGYDPWADSIGHINLQAEDELIRNFRDAGFRVLSFEHPAQTFGFLLSGDILWGLNELSAADLPVDIRLLKAWHGIRSRITGLRATLDLFYFLTEQAELLLHLNPKYGGTIYFKLVKD
jgi:ubiquinone/menaquinone biosynthesis C-methylase UbiE